MQLCVVLRCHNIELRRPEDSGNINFVPLEIRCVKSGLLIVLSWNMVMV